MSPVDEPMTVTKELLWLLIQPAFYAHIALNGKLSCICLLYPVLMVEAEGNHEKKYMRKKHCFLRLNGLRSSERDPDMYRNGDPVRAVIVDTK